MLEKLQAGRLKLNKRCTFIFVLFLLFALVLCGRLFYLQVINYDEYQKYANII